MASWIRETLEQIQGKRGRKRKVQALNQRDSYLDACRLAKSVVTDLPAACIDECFHRVKETKKAGSRFFLTIFPEDGRNRRRLREFSQPWSFHEGLAGRYGYVIESRATDYSHPTGQTIVGIIRA